MKKKIVAMTGAGISADSGLSKHLEIIMAFGKNYMKMLLLIMAGRQIKA